MAPQPASDLILLYDGLCALCNGTVQFILARDRVGSMRFAPLQGEFARGVIARHAELRGVDSLVLVSRGPAGDERVAVRSGAVLEIFRYVGGPWRGALLLRAVPAPVRDWVYDMVARIRYRLFGRYESCPLPNETDRERFLG